MVKVPHRGHGGFQHVVNTELAVELDGHGSIRVPQPFLTDMHRSASRFRLLSKPSALRAAAMVVAAQIVRAHRAEAAAGAQGASRCAEAENDAEPERAVEECVDEEAGPDWT